MLRSLDVLLQIPFRRLNVAAHEANKSWNKNHFIIINKKQELCNQNCLEVWKIITVENEKFEETIIFSKRSSNLDLSFVER